MDNNEQHPHGFAIPESFLSQLGEFTRGYMLLVCNDKGELYAHEAYDNPVIKLGIINFADLHLSAAIRHMHNIALKEEESMDVGDPDEGGDDILD
jgi:hypothetical protein